MKTTKIVGGSLWMIAMRWSMRVIGLVSTVILARLLTPEDFGLVAMAAITVGLFDLLASTGVDLALLQNQKATREHYDTAWTIQVIQGVIVTLLLFFAIEPAAIYFDEPRVRAALAVLALRPLVDGFTNIGIVAFRKELDFAREFRFQVIHKFAGFLIVVVLAVLWRSYWALIVGRVVAGLIAVAISYGMHPYRPRVSFAKMGEIWSFSQWLLLARIGDFGKQQSDKFVVGGTSGTEAMGGYHVAKEIGSMLSHELVYPIRRALFPNFAILVADRVAFERTVLLLIGVIATLIVPVQLGLAAVAVDFVAIVLGPQWSGIAELIAILAVAGLASSLAIAVEFLLPVTDNTRLAAAAAWLELVLLVPVLIVVARSGDLVAVSIARLAVAVAFLPLMFAFVSRSCGIGLGPMLRVMWRPLSAGIAMFLVVRAGYAWFPDYAALRLAAAIPVGAVTYCVTMLVLWHLAGRPTGVETMIWKRALQRKK